jgi:hypothetical protein
VTTLTETAPSVVVPSVNPVVLTNDVAPTVPVPEKARRTRGAPKQDRFAYTFKGAFLKSLQKHANDVGKKFDISDYRKVAIDAIAELVSYKPTPADYGTKTRGIPAAHVALERDIVFAWHEVRYDNEELAEQLDRMSVQLGKARKSKSPLSAAEFARVKGLFFTLTGKTERAKREKKEK